LFYYRKKGKKADWSKRQLRMEFNAKEYDWIEPVYVRLFLKNMSDDDQLYSMAFDHSHQGT